MTASLPANGDSTSRRELGATMDALWASYGYMYVMGRRAAARLVCARPANQPATVAAQAVEGASAAAGRRASAPDGSGDGGLSAEDTGCNACNVKRVPGC